ncbi:NAD(P)H-dependent oxidoreductase [Pseudomonas aeruginosa]|nr:NAD(P)H-dependent oxidoreductase [Pseudomonas aeruginosa]MCS8829181.1 NAD(P)H-dependent oxidoreductase [Pseudomonas aeruginosa]MCS8873998.1 NAD(P)H-dependent oxidoreductase [Pseudomonas aeruginosa]MCS8908004.1 NAD(P)H-dependent oxidoreductase [Pseudomonas aeruginosa]MCS8914055.1 NAD(P)H-dependent oxidoreductase [Pseudomonas aeruginosa]
MALPTLIIHAHPHPSRSHVTSKLLEALEAAPDVRLHSLYESYPDFDIDVSWEQQALLEASLVIWLSPVYWYGVPALMKHWMEQVLVHGWAYGSGGTALYGKTVWWVGSAGAPEDAYTPGGAHMRRFDDFTPPLEQTARYCGMSWLTPFVVYGGHSVPAEVRDGQAQELTAIFAKYRSTLALNEGTAK